MAQNPFAVEAVDASAAAQHTNSQVMLALEACAGSDGRASQVFLSPMSFSCRKRAGQKPFVITHKHWFVHVKLANSRLEKACIKEAPSLSAPCRRKDCRELVCGGSFEIPLDMTRPVVQAPLSTWLHIPFLAHGCNLLKAYGSGSEHNLGVLYTGQLSGR